MRIEVIVKHEALRCIGELPKPPEESTILTADFASMNSTWVLVKGIQIEELRLPPLSVKAGYEVILKFS